MSVQPQQLLDRLFRQELYAFTARVFETLHPGAETFAMNWHIEAMCFELMRVARGENARLLITVPPRHLKSITASVAFTAWLLGRDPSMRIMVASYGDDLAKRHGQDCRTVMQTEWYRRLFPRTVLSKEVTTDLQTTANGFRKAVSLAGAITGFGCDIMIVDDMMKAGDAGSPIERQRVKDVYDQTLFSRLNDKQKGAIIAIQQRLHEDDLAAYLISKGGFLHLNFPAYAEANETIAIGPGRVHRRKKGEVLFPTREPRETLEMMRRDMGPVVFAAQYQQNPVAPGGNRFRWEWVKTYDTTATPERDELLSMVQSWDTACGTEPSNDYSVCLTFGLRKDGQWLLMAADRDRLDYPSLKRRVLSLQRHWGAEKVLIEDAASGRSLLQDLRHDVRCRRHGEELYGVFRGLKPQLDKETRLDAQTGKVEAGVVLFPSEASWLPALKQELLAFPMGKHDDQVDALSQFLAWLGTPRGELCTLTGLNGGIRPRPPSRAFARSRQSAEAVDARRR